jgi:hypothetical protein
MGSFIESRALADYVTRIPLVQRDRPPLFMRETKGGYVIAELVKYLHGTEYWSIRAGVMFTRYVVAAFIRILIDKYLTFSSYILDKKIPVEITVLCRLLEIVAGSVIMARALNWRGLHGVTLPRSWILENVQKLHRVQKKDVRVNLAWEMLQPFRDLLERVYSDSDIGEPDIESLLFDCST